MSLFGLFFFFAIMVFGVIEYFVTLNTLDKVKDNPDFLHILSQYKSRYGISLYIARELILIHE